jgi:hypothetical protein
MATEDKPEARGRASVPETEARGRASVPETREVTSRIYPTVPEPPPVFVDDSGRRGRLVGWLALAFVLVGLALVVALWWSQASSTAG